MPGGSTRTQSPMPASIIPRRLSTSEAFEKGLKRESIEEEAPTFGAGGAEMFQTHGQGGLSDVEDARAAEETEVLYEGRRAQSTVWW